MSPIPFSQSTRTHILRAMVPTLVMACAASREDGPREPRAAQTATATTAAGPRGESTTAPVRHAGGARPEDRDQVDPDGIARRGDTLSARSAIDVDAAHRDVKSLDGTIVKLRGKVDAACARKGCWMTLANAGGDKHVRITAKNYAFFVPRASIGMEAVVEGELNIATLDVATAQHLDDDRVASTGKPAARVTAPREELAITATGLELRPHPTN